MNARTATAGWLPPAPPLALLLQDYAERRIHRDDEVQDVQALLLDHADPAAGPTAQCQAVALAVALACLGDNHLWQDLRLAHRGELNALLRHWFPRLAAKNTGDMKWKKFFYRQLCEAAEVLICKSPSCAVCSDYVHCFERPNAAETPPPEQGGPQVFVTTSQAGWVLHPR